MKCVDDAVGFYCGRIPYIMIQACMYNRKEYKVVLAEGKAVYLASIAGHNKRQSIGGINKSFSVRPHDALMEFAEQIVLDAKYACPHMIMDGLVRVDIFEKLDHTFVVNELEGFEANYYAGNNTDEILYHGVTDFLRTYWSQKIVHCFSKLTL
jgi:hypothetical protein